MLTSEQQQALERGTELYLKTYGSWEDKLCDARLDLLSESMGILAEFVDDVDDVYYRLIFANVIQDMQNTNRFELSDECQESKIIIYLQTMKWFNTTDTYQTNYKPFLWSAFTNLGAIFLKGEEMEQNDDLAWGCFRNLQVLEHPMAEALLSDFVQDKATGKWRFIGNRPN